MSPHLKHLLESCLALTGKLLPLALSFIDDIALLILAKVGIQIPGLAWLGPVLLLSTTLFLVIRWLKHRSNNERPS